MTKTTKTLTANHKRAIALCVRFLNSVVDALDAANNALDFDSRYDGGEFSGPAMNRQLTRAVELNARRFGFANADVAYNACRILINR